MRNSIGARVALVFGFLAASLAYGSWTAQRTALDSAATGEVARAVLESPPVQVAMTERLQEQVASATTEHELRPEVAAAIAKATSDPRFVNAFADAITELHRQALGEGAGQITIDVGAATVAVQDTLARVDPTLAQQVAAEQVQVDLNDADLPHIVNAASAARTVMWLSLVAAIVLLPGGVAMHPERRRASRRVGRRIVCLAIGPLLLFVVAPKVLERMDGDAPSVATSVLDVYAWRVLPSAFVIVAAGLALWATARLWPASTTAVEPAAAGEANAAAPDGHARRGLRRSTRPAPRAAAVEVTPERMYL